MPATNIPYELLKPSTRFDLERVFIGEQGRGILQYQAECVDLQAGSNSIKHLEHQKQTNNVRGKRPNLNAGPRLERDD
jgi:hypothetical protein